MTDSLHQDSEMQLLLHRVGTDDRQAVEELIQHNCSRLAELTHRMLGRYPRVKRWAETDDVLQSALVRLLKALQDVKPESPRDFLALATLQIRRELIDLARRYYGPEGIGANHDSQANRNSAKANTIEQSDLSNEPSSLAQWCELHQHLDSLPGDEREAVGLLFYQGLSQAEAAEILQVSVRTIQRRWHSALFKLHRVWNGEWPR